MGENYEILKTNLQPFFWKKVKDTIRQNKKSALQEFLFGKYEEINPDNKGSNPIHSVHTSQASRIQILQDQIQRLHNKVDSLTEQVERLQQKIIQFEQNQTLEIKKAIASQYVAGFALRQLLKPSQATKIDQQGDSILKSEHSPQSPFKTSEQIEEYNIPSDQDKAQNRVNFITLGRISEQEKIEIIQRGFQLQLEGKISLKNYYESTYPNSLVQSKGYSIKYESIRRTKLYQQLKPSNN
jgi:TolA-binding protein